MLQKAMMTAAAITAMAVAAAVGVISLAFAIYGLLKDPLTPAGASAAVAAICAVTIALAGLIAARAAKAAEDKAPSEPETLSLVTQLMDLVRDKPLAVGGVALAAGLIVMRNPQVIGVILRTLLDAWSQGGAAPKGRRGKG
ncbi:MAG: hypothetical protein P4L64_03525 [Caulobacteraceae bacterium]|nr:hypothetical protein [Caulobacteraceae bacterium]